LLDFDLDFDLGLDLGLDLDDFDFGFCFDFDFNFKLDFACLAALELAPRARETVGAVAGLTVGLLVGGDCLRDVEGDGVEADVGSFEGDLVVIVGALDG